MRSIGWLACAWSCVCAAQWNLPTRLQLDGTDQQDRQLSGLAAPQDATDGTRAISQRDQTIQYGITSGSDQLALTLTPAPAAYSPGMMLSIEPSAANTGAATLNVNGLGAVPIVKSVSLPLDSGDLRPGIPAQLVFDGTAFQLISQWHPACPTGYMAISRDVCIEAAVHDSSNWFSATNQCVNSGARLCSMGEWYQGCAMPGGIFSSVLAFEWIDEAANNTSDAKLMGMDGLGTIDCKNGGLATPLAQRVFRCCWDR